MTNFNARINNVRIANFNTKPQNLPQFQNPFLLLSDTEALNKILDGGVGTTNDRVPGGRSSVPNPAGDLEMGGNIKSTPKPRSQMPTQSAERLARGAGLIPTSHARITKPSAPVSDIHHNDPAIIAPTANRDNPSTSMPDRFPTSREGLFDNLSDDGESGDEGAHGGSGYVPPANPNAPGDEMGDEGHDGTTPATATRTATSSATRTATSSATSSATSPTANPLANRLNTMTGALSGTNTAATATHPPIVTATRLKNNVGVSNSTITSLYASLTVAQRATLNGTAGSTASLRSNTNPAFQKLLPANIRNNKDIQSYRVDSSGNIYAYAYYATNKPIYIGNWRESREITNPGTQPDNPARVQPRQTTQRTTSNGSTIHSGSSLVINGRVNKNVGLPTSMNTVLATSNGKALKEVKYNPITNKFTLYYGNKLASGRYPSKRELTPPDPPPKKRTILQDVRDVVSGAAGANYMSDRLSSRSTRQP
tara:strand:+ start:322 stop:1767 length:1446 start_codon:yes stop_codon:yes gene_type:complete